MKIGKVHQDGGDTKALAKQIIADTYDYADGKVSFKPTLAFGPNTFRKTPEGALAYFLGGNAKYPEGSGFALTMGNVYLISKSGEEVMVDKTFAFRKCTDGELRLIVHKSALPFTPAE